MPRTLIFEVTRQRDNDGATLHFVFTGWTKRARRSTTSFIAKDNMPASFTGERGWFEIEKVHAKPWPFFRALRQVDPPSRA